MSKDEEKKEKKSKRKSLAAEDAPATEDAAGADSPVKKSKKRKSEVGAVDVAMEDVEAPAEAEGTKKSSKDKEEFYVPIDAIAPIAAPLAGKKLSKKLFKTVKKASKARQLKRGVKEVVKALRKGEKGLLLLASNITPIDILSHLPVLAEDSQVKYCWVLAKEELGQASGTKRATSCVLICEAPRKRKAAPADGDKEDGKDWKEGWDDIMKEVSELESKIVI